MLSRSQRLSGDQVRSILSAKSGFLHTRLTTIRFVSRNDQDPARFSVVVSKKVAKNAVVRNLMRRRAYSVLGKEQFPFGRDYIITLKEKASFSDYKADILAHISRL